MPHLRSRLAAALRGAVFLPGMVLPGIVLPGLAQAALLHDPTTGEAVVLAEAPSNSTLGAYLAGQVAGARQDLTAAARFMLEVQAADPENKELLSLTFATCAAAGLMDDARRLAPAVVAANPQDGSALLVLAAGSAMQGDWQGVRADAARLASDGLAGALRALIAAWATLPDRGLDAAKDALQPLARQPGIEVLLQLHLALMADVSGDVAEAKAAYEKALAVSADKRSLRLALLVGNFYERNGETATAVKLYQDFLAGGSGLGVVEAALQRAEAGGAAPKPLVGSAAEGMAEVLFQIASILAQESVLDPALIQVNLARELKPGFDGASMLLGEILQKQNRRAEAIAAYQSVAADSLHAWSAGLSLAEVYYDEKRVDEAVATYEQLAAAQPKDYQPLFLEGNILRAEQRFAEAADAYDRALARVGAPQRWHWPLFYYRGIAYERQGKWAEAEADFLKALELEPEQPQVMNYLAYSWTEQKVNLDRAREMLTRAVELRPQDGYIVDSLGWLLYRQKDYAGAVGYLERAVELEPGEAVINDHLGDAYWQVGRKREARVQWNRALSFAPADDLDEDAVRQKLEGGLQGDGL